MRRIGSFTDSGKIWLSNLGPVAVIEYITSSSLDGQLRKWRVRSMNDGKIYFLKASSVSFAGDMLECESECIACRLAEKFGIADVVFYNLDELHLGGQSIKVSADFVTNGVFLTMAQQLPDISKLFGEQKVCTGC